MASLFDRNLNFMCESEVPIPVCIRGFFAYCSASAATFMSFSTDLVSPQTVAFFTIFETASTEEKSPGLDTGKPASIISTPNKSNCSAMITFWSVFNLHPGTCSPSRRVVSNIWTFVLDICVNILYIGHTNLIFLKNLT